MTDVAVKPDETTPETPETTEAERKTPAIKLEDLPDLTRSLVLASGSIVNELNPINEKLNSVGDVGKLVSEAVDNSTDKRVVSLREKMEAAMKAFNEAEAAAQKIVKPTLDIPSETEIAELETKQKEKVAALNSFAGAFDVELKTKGVTEKVTLFDYLDVIVQRKRGAKAGQGEGTSRPRVDSLEYTHDLSGESGWTKATNAKGESTFSALLVVIKKETGESLSANDLHEAWYKQVGVSDWKDANEVTTFSYSVTPKGKKEPVQYMIRVTK